MKTLRLLFLTGCLLTGQALVAQTLSKSVTGTAGLTQSNENFKLSFTLGEPVIGTMSHEDRQLGNGFFPSLDYSLLVIPEAEYSTGMEVFPNPSTNFFICRQKERHAMHLRITDVDGQLILEKPLLSGDQTGVLKWKPGIYLLEVTDQVTGRKLLFKMIKTKL